MATQKKLWLIVSALIALPAVVLVVVGIQTARPRVAVAPSCRLIFLDVGQGDAILIQTPDHQDVLIDGGPSGEISRQLGKYLGFGNNEIELAILTHPDADHLTGLLAVVEDWPVQTILTSGVVAETKLFQRWQGMLPNLASTVTPVHAGQSFKLGDYFSMELLWPDQSWNGQRYTSKAIDGRGGINDTSVGTKIECAGSTMVAIGDASDRAEERLVASGADLRADLLKISHHGSKFSSSHKFLRAVNPDAAVITVGVKNRYGHPHPVVLERLAALDIPVWRTDLQGMLEFHSVSWGWETTP